MKGETKSGAIVLQTYRVWPSGCVNMACWMYVSSYSLNSFQCTMPWWTLAVLIRLFSAEIQDVKSKLTIMASVEYRRLRCRRLPLYSCSSMVSSLGTWLESGYLHLWRKIIAALAALLWHCYTASAKYNYLYSNAILMYPLSVIWQINAKCIVCYTRAIFLL